MDLKNKKVLVFGTGISGIGACSLLQKYGAEVVLYDGNEKLNKEEIEKKLASSEQVEIILGELAEDVMDTLSLVVMSPGVPVDLPAVLRMKEKGIPVWGEVELAYSVSSKEVLAITGTNGKTTTTSLLGEIMNAWKDSVYVVGNIGNPYTEAAMEMQDDSIVVAEISSFQLETIASFRPKVSAVLNITPDHLNRHHTMEEYIRVKESITENQTPEDTCVLNYEDEELRKFGDTLQTKVLYFSSQHKLDKGLYLDGEDIVYQTEDEKIIVCSVKELQIVGSHNYENVMAAVGMAAAYGVPMETIKDVVKSFQAVEHRIEFVTEKDGVVYYNDSKGTNPDAAIKGIQAMNRPTLLIGGGYDKGSSYEEWIRSFEGKVKYLVLIGATRDMIAETARKCGFTAILMADSLEDAVRICREKSEPGDAVLLSPACASWDMFPSYEVRGKMFKEFVKA